MAALATALLGAEAGYVVAKRDLVERAADAMDWPVRPPQGADTRSFTWARLETNLHSLETLSVPLNPTRAGGGGGGIVEIGEAVVFVTRDGALGELHASGRLRYLDAQVPMNADGLAASGLDPAEHWKFRAHDLLAVPAGGEAFDLYASHHALEDGCIGLRISRARAQVRAGRLQVDGASWETFFRAEPCVDLTATGGRFGGHQSGGRLVRYDDTSILFSVGDLKMDGDYLPNRLSPDLDNSLGKILKIDLATGGHDVFARGLRNPQGLMIDARGRVWETEHGPQGGDELNLISPGVDYGWPNVTLGVNYGGDEGPRRPWPSNPVQGRHDGYAAPVFAFVPSVAVSNLALVEANEFPLWADDLLIGSLKAQTLFRIRLHKGRALYVEPIPLGVRVRDVITLRDGRLAVFTDRNEIVFVRRARTEAAPAFAVRGYRQARAFLTERRRHAAPAAAKGEALFTTHCATCHDLGGPSEGGPDLSGVLGRAVAGDAAFPYSDALRRFRGRWNESRLKAFLLEPERMTPGTNMPDLALSRHEVETIVEFLESVADQT